MQLQILHETRYDYVPAVETAQHMAYLQPLSNARQQLMRHALVVIPPSAQQTTTPDVFGNMRCFFSLQSAHEQLIVLSDSLVVTSASETPASTVSWEAVRERFRYTAGGAFDAACEFVFTSPYVPRHPDFLDYARPSFGVGVPLMDAARDLMSRIHTDFVYESQSTQVNTSALEALAQRKGVCQDFAHIMLACLRAMGLAARYVSGYLLTEPPPGQPRLTGSDASHAWVSVYIPDLPGDSPWCDFDPTNDRCGWGSPGEEYVTLAIGRDYADVSPIRGVIHGGAHHTLTVGVTVRPVESSDLQTQTQTQTQSQQPQLQGQFQNQGQHHSAQNFGQSQSQSQSQDTII